jgi:hypothetical protein
MELILERNLHPDVPYDEAIQLFGQYQSHIWLNQYIVRILYRATVKEGAVMGRFASL